MNPQKKAWKTRKSELCCICLIRPKRSKKAKTCSQSCAGKLAWKHPNRKRLASKKAIKSFFRRF